MRPFVFRGPNSFYFKRKRRPLERRLSVMAEKRVNHPGAGGEFNPITGNGEAWHKDGDILKNGWFRTRKIKAGQWDGPWVRVRNQILERKEIL